MTKTKTPKILVLSITVILIGITSTISLSSATNHHEDTIPEWVQNVAFFWGQGEISESEFINALEFLADEGILRLPAAESAQAEEILRSLEDMQQRIEQVEATQTGERSSETKLDTAPTDSGLISNTGQPLSKIKTFDFVDGDVLRVSSTDPFLMTVCAHSPISAGHPLLWVRTGLPNDKVIINTELNKNQDCFTIGGEANDYYDVFSLENYNKPINGRISVQTTQSAFVSFVP